MKCYVDCPQCGSLNVRLNPDTQSICCQSCNRWFTERQMLEHMRDKDGMERNAPAFRCLDLKPKAKSQAARAVFG